MMITVGTYQFDRVCDFFESSNIETIAYNYAQRTMLVRFVTLDEYVYFDVEPFIFSVIIGAESVGKIFNKLIVQAEYNYKKVNRNAS